MAHSLPLLLLQFILASSCFHPHRYQYVHQQHHHQHHHAPASTTITQSTFVRRKSVASVTNRWNGSARRSLPPNQNHYRSRRRRQHKISMLRNFDLPEALIFYGLDTVIDSSSSTASSSSSSPPPPSIRPGVLRLIEEAKDVGLLEYSLIWNHYRVNFVTLWIYTLVFLFR